MQNQVQENNFLVKPVASHALKKTGKFSKFSLKFTKTQVLTRRRNTKFSETQNQLQKFPANLINL